MPRTTAELVQGIVKIGRGADLTPFIATANVIVTEHCGSAGYTDDELELIERWLSAHFYKVLAPTVASQYAEGAGQSYTIPTKVGFGATLYGQTAMRLDAAGGLAALDAKTNKGGKQRVQVGYLGRQSPRIREDC